MKIGKNRVISILIIIAGLFIVWQSTKIKSIFAVSTKDIGPSAFPRFAAIGLIICGIGKFITSKEDETYKFFFSKKGWMKVGIGAVSFVLYLFAMEYIGFILATPLILYGLVRLIAWEKKTNPVIDVLFCAIVTGAVYYVFHVLMHIQLPSGVLWG